LSGRRILVVDVGGNNVKLRHSGMKGRRKFPSGPALTPEQLVDGVRGITEDWPFDVVSIGCPGPVSHDRITLEPVNLGRGWVGFDFAAAFGCPVKLINDAAMQALGSYEGGKMLYMGLGTGLGMCLIYDSVVVPLEVAHLPYKTKWTYEDCIGKRGLDRMGRKRWEGCVRDVTARFKTAFLADYVMLGGGNVKLLKELPPDCRRGHNRNAFKGGFRLWEDAVQTT